MSFSFQEGWNTATHEVSHASLQGLHMAQHYGPQAATAIGVVAALTAYLLYKAVELIYRVMRKDPHNPLLWSLAILSLTSLLLSCLIRFQSPTLLGVFLATFTALLIDCKVDELALDPKIQRQMTREVFVDDILHRPWVSR